MDYEGVTENIHMPQPWARIVDRCKTTYERNTGKTFDADLIQVVSADPYGASTSGDRVALGYARKAVRRMRHTCQVCGKPGRVRYAAGAHFVVHCPGCHVAQSFSDQVMEVLSGSDDYAEPTKAVWHEHELPELIRAVLPSHCWRHTHLPDVGILRYLTAGDLDDLKPWLIKLSTLLAYDRRQKRYAYGSRPIQ